MVLLVRTVDKIGSTPDSQVVLTKRGDVIVVHDEAATWGTQELANVEWVLIASPDMDQATAEAFLVPEPPPLDNPTKPVQKRLFKLDLDLLGAPLLDGHPVVRTAHYSVDQHLVADYVRASDTLVAAKVEKPPAPDLDVIGAASEVIG